MIVHIKIEDINDSPPVFESDCLTFYIPENSPIGTTVGEIIAHDPDEGTNAVVHYSIKGKDQNSCNEKKRIKIPICIFSFILYEAKLEYF